MAKDKHCWILCHWIVIEIETINWRVDLEIQLEWSVANGRHSRDHPLIIVDGLRWDGINCLTYNLILIKERPALMDMHNLPSIHQSQYFNGSWNSRINFQYFNIRSRSRSINHLSFLMPIRTRLWSVRAIGTFIDGEVHLVHGLDWTHIMNFTKRFIRLHHETNIRDIIIISPSLRATSMSQDWPIWEILETDM